ncbi:MAG: hypothetical protein E6J91_34730 [Deltaproteobacteria bacterium]|nr:MAG: hypothetical protein E6J91_34730 [Deltaproteobacteria bacterium]
MSPARTSFLLALGAALASVALPGCDVLEDTMNGPAVPPGGPPAPGFATDMVNAHNARVSPDVDADASGAALEVR